MNRPLKHTMLFTFFIGALVFITNGQSTAQADKYLLLPSDILLVVVAQQPDSPVKIENTKALLNLGNGSVHLVYELRNISKKRIRRIELSKWSLGGGGGDLVPFNVDGGLLPNQKVEIGKVDESRIGDLSDSMKNKFGLVKENMAGIILIFVKRVWLDDGTLFEPTKMSDNLEEFLSRLEFLEKEN